MYCFFAECFIYTRQHKIYHIIWWLNGYIFNAFLVLKHNNISALTTLVIQPEHFCGRSNTLKNRCSGNDFINNFWTKLDQHLITIWTHLSLIKALSDNIVFFQKVLIKVLSCKVWDDTEYENTQCKLRNIVLIIFRKPETMESYSLWLWPSVPGYTCCNIRPMLFSVV